MKPILNIVIHIPSCIAERVDMDIYEAKLKEEFVEYSVSVSRSCLPDDVFESLAYLDFGHQSNAAGAGVDAISARIKKVFNECKGTARPPVEPCE